MSGMNRLTDKSALITGGESGIGLETARLFVAEGARVHLVGIDAARLEAAGNELGPGAATTRADVTDAAQVRAAVAEAVAGFGRLDVVFSNAGISGSMG